MLALFNPEYAKQMNYLLISLSLFFATFVPNTLFSQSWNELHENTSELYFSGQYDEAMQMAKKTLSHAEKEFGEKHHNYVESLSNVALILYTKGDYQTALDLYRKCLNLTEKVNGKEHNSYGEYLTNIGLIYKNIEQFDQAFKYYNLALEHCEKHFGKEDKQYGVNLNNLAGAYLAMGQFDEALPLYKLALENTEQTLGKDHHDYGTSLNNLAVVYGELNQNSKSIEFYRKALTVLEKTLGKDHPNYQGVYANLAVRYSERGEFDRALSIYQEIIENPESISNTAAYASHLSNLANICMTHGYYEEAEMLYLEAKKEVSKGLGKSHSQYGLTLNGLASLYETMGKDKKAISLYTDALENIVETLGTNHPTFGTTLQNLANICRENNKMDVAYVAYEKLIEHELYNINLAFGLLSETEKEQFILTTSANFESYLSFFQTIQKDKPEAAGLMYDIVLASKGMVLNSTVQMRKAIANSGDSKVIEKMDEWILLKASIGKQYLLPVADRNEKLNDWKKEADKLEKELLNESMKITQSLSVENKSWKDVQDQLKENEVAVEFVSYQFKDASGWMENIIYGALILKKDDTYPKFVYLFQQEEFDVATKKNEVSTDNFVASLYRGAMPVNSKPSEKNSDKLYNLIWKPIEHLIPEKSNVYYSLSGSLQQIAFAAIKNKENSMLSDLYELEQLSSTSKILNTTPKNDLKIEDISLFGGVDYDLENEKWLSGVEQISESNSEVSVGFSADFIKAEKFKWNYLPGTLKEIETINELALQSKINTQKFSGNRALEDNLKQLSYQNSPSILHISTHGFFYPNPLAAKKVSRTEGKKEYLTYNSNENPLLYSALLMGGANRSWLNETVPEGLDDGILTAYEASFLMLPKTKLVVLSACETGLGEIKGSEGVFGLQRAFKQAGVDYLLMSLWKVPDTETAEFMTYFYDSLFMKNSITDSFRSAQSKMKEKYRDSPYKWAAFVLVR